ncbi:MAG: sulfatase [Bacteroidota bacterium]
MCCILGDKGGKGSWQRIFRVFLVSLFIGVLGCSPNKEKERVAEKSPVPNIIFLLTDDQRWDALGAMGNTLIHTPNLDSLAKEGVHFTNAYVTTSICAVSRASMLTGQYASRHGILDFKTGLKDRALDNTYPMLLKKQGYRIGFIGKYGVGSADTHPKTQYDFWACTEKGQPDYENVDVDGNYLHYTDLVAKDMRTFIEGTDDRPFCLSVSFKAPHVQDGDPRQFIPNPRYNTYYEDTTIPEPKTAAPKYWESFPDFFRTDANIGRERWKLRFNTPEKYQQSVKNYYRLITGVDHVLGRLGQQLREKGLAKNTVIVFMGDNGMFLGEHGLAGKWYPYEESIRVPLIIHDPRRDSPKGRINKIALNVDVAPTILGLAGIEAPGSMQGMDLMNRVARDTSTRTFFFYEHSFFGSPRIPVTEAVIGSQWKYIRYPDHDYEELFHLSRDSLEENNLVGNPEYADLLQQQRRRCDSLREAIR